MSEKIEDVLLKPEIIESYNKIDAVLQACRQWEADTGINPTKIYCSRTGRVIGCIDRPIIHSSLTTIESNDIEEIMDELTIRCILSMRPSPDLMYLNKDSMKALINHNPIAACVFLLCKAFESNQLLYKKVSPLHSSTRIKHRYDESEIDRKIEWNRGLIELTHRIKTEINIRNVKRFTLMLLEVDARIGLHKLNAPSNCWGFDLLTKESTFQDFIKLVRHYKNELIKLEKRAHNWHNEINTLSFETFTDIGQTTIKKQTKKQRVKERKINNLTLKIDEFLKGNDSIEDIMAKTDSALPKQKPKIQTGFKINLNFNGGDK